MGRRNRSVNAGLLAGMSSILTITGPTAIGKTALCIRLAEHFNAEIVSVDSRQIYRELDIGTAKPSPEERSRVRHHFIDERGLDDPISAGQFAKLAEDRIAEILSRDKTAIVTGGSTLYLHALQHGLANIPPVMPTVRDALQDRLVAEGSAALYRELEGLDPASAGTMDETKSQRIVRALEVYYGTGKTLSSFFDHQPPPRFSYTTFVLSMDRPALYDRIGSRVDEMLGAGLVEEVRMLMQTGFSPTLPVLRTIGYQEVIQYLQGVVDETEMIRLIKRNTRRYAKRQLTWFKRFQAYQWIPVSAGFERVLQSYTA